MTIAEIPDYQKTLNGAIRQILEAVSRRLSARDLLDEIAAIAASSMKAGSCSIFLRDEGDEEARQILRIRGCGGPDGKALLQARANYYIPKREPFVKVASADVQEYVKLYQQLCKYADGRGLAAFMDVIRARAKEGRLSDVYLGLVNNGDADGIVRLLIEQKKLTMGITAFVVWKGEAVRATGAEARQHLEWRGSYDAFFAQAGTSIMEVPLTDGKLVEGVMKIENAETSDAAIVVGFGKQHHKFLEALAECVIPALKESREGWSYAELCARPLRKKVLGLKKESLCGQGNRLVADSLVPLCDEWDVWNLKGTERIYEAIRTANEKVMDALELGRHKKVLQSILDSDALLRVDPNFRDHFIHQFQVFLLGYAIINSCSPAMGALIRYMRSNGAVAGTDEDAADLVLKCWLLTCLYHDVAYSIERHRTWLGYYFDKLFALPGHSTVTSPQREKDLLENLGLRIPWGNLLTAYSGALEYYKTRLCKLIYDRIGQHKEENNREIVVLLTEKLLKEQNHGIFGALFLMRSAFEPSAVRRDDQNSEFVALEAALAIALHTPDIYHSLLRKKLDRLEADLLPFAFLLVFCDNAQDWGRPRVSELVPPQVRVNPSDVKLSTLELDEQHVFVKLDYLTTRSEEWHDVMEKMDRWTTYLGSVRFQLDRSYP